MVILGYLLGVLEIEAFLTPFFNVDFVAPPAFKVSVSSFSSLFVWSLYFLLLVFLPVRPPGGTPPGPTPRPEARPEGSRKGFLGGPKRGFPGPKKGQKWATVRI